MEMEIDLLYSKSVTTINILVLSLLLILSVSIYYLSGKKINTLNALVIFSMYLPIIVTFFYSPTSYSVSPKSIAINKVIGIIKVQKNDIVSLKEINPQDLGSFTRKFASGGLFGYYGLFNSEKEGNIRVYCGTLDTNLVLIKLKSGKKILVSPYHIGKFIDLCGENTPDSRGFNQ
ncbi:PH domain-containing protein [Carboxylicivirga sp. RSCT41]|uniref:PH domain-containing protein n=1 Tax=Carboxylicivirga agarovorans TaxID=3417570 RepID=UPI003D346734